MKVKVITLWQPYATLVALGIKHYETRSWLPKSRLLRGETLFIHAAKRKPKGREQDLIDSPYYPELKDIELIYGAIIALVTFKQVFATSELKLGYRERLIGNYENGNYAWLLENAKMIDPIPCKGQQGIWYYDKSA